MQLSSLRYWRTILPATALVGTVVLVARHKYPLPPDSQWLLRYSQLDPLLLLQYMRWEGTFPVWGWLPIVTIVLTLMAGRVFCGWLCPVGGLLAVLQSLRQWGGPPRWAARLYNYRYGWLLFLLGLMMLGSGWALYLSPFQLITEELSRIWRGQVPWMLTTLIILGVVAFPRVWCVFLCPTGLLLSFFARWRWLRVSPPEECVHCGICEKICPTGAAKPQPGVASQDCLVCGRCSERCPAGSFELARNSGGAWKTPDNGSLFTRREIIRSGTALLVACAAIPILVRSAGANPLRPPGALEEAEFLARCSRCGRCIKVCPAECIKAMPINSGPALFLTPIIVPREARCELTQLCQQVCPTGALAPVPVEKALIGLAEIDQSLCIGWAEGRLCLLCQEQCPLQAIDSDSQDRPSVVKDRCVGCGACENSCPVDDPAIVVRPQPKRRRA